MPISSPCVRNCCLDDADVCLGCGRTVQEVISWGEAGDREKRKILSLSKERLYEREKKFKFE